MKKAIVITSIFPPTEAIEKFSKVKDYKLIVVGDKKTPSDWSYPNTNYISVDAQEKSGFKLASLLPYNHYCRKMIGYLTAIQEGAEEIVDTDDDNIPYEDWDFPAFDGTFELLRDDSGFVNVYKFFTEQHIWPRGLPLELITKPFDPAGKCKQEEVNVGIWQGLADEDPDVDAIYRLTSDEPCFFNKREPVVLGKGTLCPFNTQNTLIRKELFPLLYLPTYVTFRFTDILRGLVAQPILWLYGYRLGFTGATVVQKRNPHDYMADFISEIPMYENTRKTVEHVEKVISVDKTVETNLYDAYDALYGEKIVCSKEMKTLEAWLTDLSKLKKTA